jgi:hypothetical protein
MKGECKMVNVLLVRRGDFVHVLVYDKDVNILLESSYLKPDGGVLGVKKYFNDADNSVNFDVVELTIEEHENKLSYKGEC